MNLISLNLPDPPGFSGFRNDATCTLSNPSADLVQALVGLPAAAGKPVTRETAIRVAAFLAGVKTLANDLAKMPLVLRSTTVEQGRQRTRPAINEPLYTLLKDCPNQYQTSFQMRWFLASQLIMAGNCFAQKITDRAGDLIGLIPLNAWQMTPRWNRETNPPTLVWRYSDSSGNYREFEQSEVWHVSSLNLEGFGLEGTKIIALAKEALSVLMAAEETAGRNFANGLGMGGFLTTPPDSDIDEIEAQKVVDRLKKDYAGSQNAGKFTFLPGGIKFEKMTFTAQESQLLESRKWNEQEVIRLLGGAPLLVKLGMGEQNSTYAASSAFLDEYFNTCLLPYTTAIEQSITRDLIPRKQWGTLYAKHHADIILRGSPKERAETNAALINSWQLTPNEARLSEDRDTIEGGDFLCGPSNGAIFSPATGEFFIPGQKPPTGGEGTDSGTVTPDTSDPDTIGTCDGSATNTAKHHPRLVALAESLAERVMRKAAKADLTAQFVSDVLNISAELAQEYINKQKQLTLDEQREALTLMAMGY
jgi:HK97 family phage portal protein